MRLHELLFHLLGVCLALSGLSVVAAGPTPGHEPHSPAPPPPHHPPPPPPPPHKPTTTTSHPSPTPDPDRPNYSYDELYALQTKLWDNFLYPANAIQAAAINSTLFSVDVRGRVDITRTFIGRELNTEYIFGLFVPTTIPSTNTTNTTTTTSLSLIGYPINYTITAFSGTRNRAAASTLLYFNATSGPFHAFLPLTLDTWISWNAAGEITQYDVVFRWFDFLLSSALRSLALSSLSLPPTTPAPLLHAAAQAALAPSLAAAVCATHAAYCAPNPTWRQYPDTPACLDFLLTQIRFGEGWELGMNTLLCRLVHEHMVAARPAVHCPHIGPGGGGYCVDDMTYAEKVTEGFFNGTGWL